MQTDSYIYLPSWVKFLALIILSATLAGGFGVALMGILAGRDAGWIEVSMAVVQISVSGLGIALVLFFSQRAISVDRLVRKSDEFLEQDVPAALQRFERITPGPLGALARVRVRVHHARGAYGAWYDAMIDDMALNFRFGLRMRNVIVNVFLPRSDFPSAAETQEILKATLKRAKDIVFTVEVTEETQERDGRDYIVIYLIQDLDSGFLFDTERRLSLLQQISLILRSLCINGRRQGLALTYDAKQ